MLTADYTEKLALQASGASYFRTTASSVVASLRPARAIVPYLCLLLQNRRTFLFLLAFMAYFLVGPMAVGPIFDDRTSILCFWGIYIPRLAGLGLASVTSLLPVTVSLPGEPLLNHSSQVVLPHYDGVIYAIICFGFQLLPLVSLAFGPTPAFNTLMRVRQKRVHLRSPGNACRAVVCCVFPCVRLTCVQCLQSGSEFSTSGTAESRMSDSPPQQVLAVALLAVQLRVTA